MPSAVNQMDPPEVDGGLRARLGFWLRNDAAHLLWPTHCLACGDPGGDGIDLCAACAACAAGLPWNAGACVRCAMPLPWLPPGRRSPDAGSTGGGSDGAGAQVRGGCLTLATGPARLAPHRGPRRLRLRRTGRPDAAAVQVPP